MWNSQLLLHIIQKVLWFLLYIVWIFPSAGIRAQLPHSYYFTTCILVLKFVNKGVFLEDIQDLHFPRKRGYFGTHLLEFGEKTVNFDVQCFTVKKGVHLRWKVSVLSQKEGSFWTKQSVFYSEKGVVLSWKVVFCCKKGGHFQTA